MKRNRRKFSSAFKVQVALEAIKERETFAELAKRFEQWSNKLRYNSKNGWGIQSRSVTYDNGCQASSNFFITEN